MFPVHSMTEELILISKPHKSMTRKLLTTTILQEYRNKNIQQNIRLMGGSLCKLYKYVTTML